MNRPYTSLSRSARGLLLRLRANRDINPYTIPSSAERYGGDSFTLLEGDCCKPDNTTAAAASTECPRTKIRERAHQFQSAQGGRCQHTGHFLRRN